MSCTGHWASSASDAETCTSIGLDRSGRVDRAALERAMDADIAAGCTPIAVVGSGGDVNTGLVDPLAELARIAHERNTWFHVDGAYGGFGLLDDRVREAYGDVAQYDSFAVDPHKWLAAPVGTGAVIVRDASVLARAFTIEAGDYDAGRQAPITSGDLGSPFDELGLGTPELGVDFSTPARGIAVWAILREIGAAGIRARVTRHLDCARHVADRARQEPELELLIEPQLSICCFRFRRRWRSTDEAAIDAFNERLLSRRGPRSDRHVQHPRGWPLCHPPLFHQSPDHARGCRRARGGGACGRPQPWLRPRPRSSSVSCRWSFATHREPDPAVRRAGVGQHTLAGIRLILDRGVERPVLGFERDLRQLRVALQHPEPDLVHQVLDGQAHEPVEHHCGEVCDLLRIDVPRWHQERSRWTDRRSARRCR